MTERQLELIWRFFKNPICVWDGDISGQKAALRAAERLFPLMKADFNIYFLTLPENLDPDSEIELFSRLRVWMELSLLWEVERFQKQFLLNI
jgi:DNA primase